MSISRTLQTRVSGKQSETFWASAIVTLQFWGAQAQKERVHRAMLGWCLSLTRLKSQNVTDYRSSLRTETSEIIRNHQNSSMEKIGIAGIACSAAGHDRQRWCRMEGIHPESLIWMNWQVNLKSLSGFFWELRTQKGFSKRMKSLEIFGVALEPSMVSRHGRLCRAGKLVGFGKDLRHLGKVWKGLGKPETIN